MQASSSAGDGPAVTRIAVSGLSKHFGDVRAVDDVSLVIEPGEFVVLVGPSGCGKTTLLRMLAGLTEPTAGQISFDASDVTALPPGQRNVAMVFQNYALFPHMSVERNLGFGLRLRRTAPAERDARIAEVAQILRIGDLLKRYPRELSGGQKQRVALGRALIRQPVAFLFDEPLSNLDQALRVEMRAEIAQLHRRYTVTTVYVTHDQVEAMTMGDRIAVMNQGRLTQVGAPDQVYNDPRDLFTAGFIGSPSMNLLRGRLGEAAGKAVFIGDGDERFQAGPAVGTGGAELANVVVGFRPEHVSLGDPASGNGIPAQVVLVEQLGREYIVHMEAGGHKLAAVSASGTPPEQGASVAAVPDEAKLYFFDPESGARLDQ